MSKTKGVEIPNYLRSIKGITDFNLNKKVELRCPKCGENFHRSALSKNWSCSKCRETLPRKVVREMSFNAINEYINPLENLNIGDKQNGNPQVQDFHPTQTNQEDPFQPEIGNDQGKIAPIYISDLTSAEDEVFASPEQIKQAQFEQQMVQMGYDPTGITYDQVDPSFFQQDPAGQDFRPTVQEAQPQTVQKKIEGVADTMGAVNKATKEAQTMMDEFGLGGVVRSLVGLLNAKVGEINTRKDLMRKGVNPQDNYQDTTPEDQTDFQYQPEQYAGNVTNQLPPEAFHG